MHTTLYRVLTHTGSKRLTFNDNDRNGGCAMPAAHMYSPPLPNPFRQRRHLPFSRGNAIPYVDYLVDRWDWFRRLPRFPCRTPTDTAWFGFAIYHMPAATILPVSLPVCGANGAPVTFCHLRIPAGCASLGARLPHASVYCA